MKVNMNVLNLAYIVNLSLTGSLGGLAFGFDTGIIGGAALYFDRSFPNITDENKQLVVSIAILGAAIGSIVSGSLAD